MGKFSFCDYVKPHGESRNVGSRNVAEFCACGVKKQNMGVVVSACLKECAGMSHI